MVRARLAVARDRPDEAVAELALVPDDSPLAAGARLLAGQVEVRRNRFRFAEQSLRAAVRLDPRLIKAHRELIFIYGFQLRRAELAAEFLALSGLTDLRFQEMFHWGMLKNESWEPGEAAGKLAKCIAADPDDRWSRLGLAENQRRMGRLEEAEATLAVLAPDDPEAIAARVRIAMDRSDVEAAEHLMASGPPADPTLARLRGRLALSRRDAAAAVRHFRVAYELQPDSREAVTGLMTALVLQGDAKAAAPLREIAATPRLPPGADPARRRRGGTRRARAAHSSSAMPARPCIATRKPGAGTGWPSPATRSTHGAARPSTTWEPPAGGSRWDPSRGFVRGIAARLSTEWEASIAGR